MNRPCDNQMPPEKCGGPVDYGPYPYVTNINQAAMQNNFYRRALWTGRYLQLTLMSIPVGGDIGAEIHPDTDQFINIVSGNAIVKFGDCMDKVVSSESVGSGSAVFVPAGTWHNIINTGRTTLKLYSVYAPPHHPRGIIQKTKPQE